MRRWRGAGTNDVRRRTVTAQAGALGVVPPIRTAKLVSAVKATDFPVEDLGVAGYNRVIFGAERERRLITTALARTGWIGKAVRSRALNESDERRGAAAESHAKNIATCVAIAASDLGVRTPESLGADGR